MGVGSSVPPFIDLTSYQDHFKQATQDCQKGPSQNRKLQDKFCLGIFIVITLIFLIFGIYVMKTSAAAYAIQKVQQTVDQYTGYYDDFNTVVDLGTKYKEKLSHKNIPQQSTHQINTDVQKADQYQGYLDDTNRIMELGSKYKEDLSHKNIPQQAADQKQQVKLSEKKNHHLKSEFINHNDAKPKSNKDAWYKDQSLKPKDQTSFLSIPLILGCGLLSIIIAIGIIFVLSKYPKQFIYGMVVVTFVLFIVGIIAFQFTDYKFVSTIIGIIGAIWLLFIVIIYFCYRQKLEISLLLLKLTGNFLLQKPFVLLAPVAVLSMMMLFCVFGVAGVISHVTHYKDLQLSNPIETFVKTPQSYLLWVFVGYFFYYFFQYVMIFLIATCIGFWYFDVKQNYLVKGLLNIVKGHIGSLTFASILIAIINVVKNAIDNNDQDQSKASSAISTCCSCCCLCKIIVKCCLSALEQILKVLNQNAVIVMSFTGQDFISSAKTSLFLVFSHFGVFVTIEMVGSILKLCIPLFIIAIPTAIAFLLNKGGIPINALIVLALSFVVSLITIEIVFNALSCIFIFYCLHNQFKKLKVGPLDRVPQSLRKLFREMAQQGGDQNNDLNQTFDKEGGFSTNLPTQIYYPGQQSNVKQPSKNYNQNYGNHQNQSNYNYGNVNVNGNGNNYNHSNQLNQPPTSNYGNLPTHIQPYNFNQQHLNTEVNNIPVNQPYNSNAENHFNINQSNIPIQQQNLNTQPHFNQPLAMNNQVHPINKPNLSTHQNFNQPSAINNQVHPINHSNLNTQPSEPSRFNIPSQQFSNLNVGANQQSNFSNQNQPMRFNNPTQIPQPSNFGGQSSNPPYAININQPGPAYNPSNQNTVNSPQFSHYPSNQPNQFVNKY